MQDRYSGDVGDFLKFGLLRALTRGEGTPLRLGVCWYLGVDEEHNRDGKHVSYLDAGDRMGRRLERCDPDLFQRLRTMIDSEERSIAAVERSGALPDGTLTYAARLSPRMTRVERRAWHKDALVELDSADLIFADPDNGLASTYETTSAKYAAVSEIGDYLRRGQSVVLYQHMDRDHGKMPIQVQWHMMQLFERTGTRALGGVIARRGTVRFFLVLAAKDHEAQLDRSVRRFADRWTPHAEYHPFVEGPC